MKKKPGVMLYFDRLTFLDRLNLTQRGELITAIIGYARDGTVPEIIDPLLGVAWDVLRPVLDLDAERYEAVCEKRRQAASRRWSDCDAIASKCMPNTNPNQTQNQIQTETETEIETQTKTHSQSQKETGRDYADSESLMELTARKRREWAAEKQRCADAGM